MWVPVASRMPRRADSARTRRVTSRKWPRTEVGTRPRRRGAREGALHGNAQATCPHEGHLEVDGDTLLEAPRERFGEEGAGIQRQVGRDRLTLDLLGTRADPFAPGPVRVEQPTLRRQRQDQLTRGRQQFLEGQTLLAALQAPGQTRVGHLQAQAQAGRIQRLEQVVVRPGVEGLAQVLIALPHGDHD